MAHTLLDNGSGTWAVDRTEVNWRPPGIRWHFFKSGLLVMFIKHFILKICI